MPTYTERRRVTDDIGVRNMTPNQPSYPEILEDKDPMMSRKTPESTEPMPNHYIDRMNRSDIQRVVANVPVSEERDLYDEEEQFQAQQSSLPSRDLYQEEEDHFEGIRKVEQANKADAMGIPKDLRWAGDPATKENREVLGSAAVGSITNASDVFITEVSKLANGLGNSVASYVSPGGEVSKYFQKNVDLLQSFQDAVAQSNPTAESVGRWAGIGTSALLTTPVFNGYAASLAGGVSGGLSSALADTGSNKEAPNRDELVDAGKLGVVSGLVGGTVGYGINKGIQALTTKGSNAVSNTILGYKADQIDVESVVQTAVSKVAGKDISKLSLEDAARSLQKATVATQRDVTALYTTRNAIAEKSKQMVDKTTLINLKTELEAKVIRGTTSDTKAALVELKDLVGTAPKMTYKEAQDMVSEVGGSIEKARRQGDLTKMKALKQVSNVINDAIDSAPKNLELEAAHAAAKARFRDDLLPLRKNEITSAVLDRAADLNYLGNFLNKTLNTTSTRTAMNKAAPGMVDELLGINMRAFKDAATDPTSNTINLRRLSTSLHKELSKSSGKYSKDGVEVVSSLAKTLDAILLGSHKTSGASETRALLAAVGINPAIGGAIYAQGVIIPKIKFMQLAGQALRDKGVTTLLAASQKLEASTNTGATSLVHSKLSKWSANILGRSLHIGSRHAVKPLTWPAKSVEATIEGSNPFKDHEGS